MYVFIYACVCDQLFSYVAVFPPSAQLSVGPRFRHGDATSDGSEALTARASRGRWHRVGGAARAEARPGRK